MKTKPALITMLALLLCAPVTHAADRELRGHTEGNGGDGVYRDGNLVLRDFIATARVEAVPDSKKYLEQFPELQQLIRDIAPGNPAFAMSVWSELTNARIWLTDADLPLLPAAATAVISGKADVQIAIRYDNDIVISRPALALVQEKEYVFLHEALHGLVRDSNSPWHHEKVRTLVRYVKENRGQYEEKTMAAVLEKFGISFSEMVDGDVSFMRRLGIAMILEQGDFNARCAVLRSGYGAQDDSDNEESRVYFRDLYHYGMGSLSNWGSYAKCKDQKPKDVLLARYPAMKEWLAHSESAILAFVYKVTIPKNLGIFDGGVLQVVLEQCKQYGRPSALAKVVQAERIVTRAEKSLQQMKADLATENDLAVAYILKTYAKAFTGEFGITGARKRLQEQRENYRSTINACTAQYGDYLNR